MLFILSKTNNKITLLIDQNSKYCKYKRRTERERESERDRGRYRERGRERERESDRERERERESGRQDRSAADRCRLQQLQQETATRDPNQNEVYT